MYRPVLDAVGGSLLLTALVALLPLLTLFVMIGVFRITAWKASITSLIVAILVAILGYSMPVGQALMSGVEGAVFGFFPILWIVINAIWIYNMTVKTGHFDVLRRSFATVSDDMRIQAVLVAFCFGALLEALAGFGTPVAISSVMLIALGFHPIKAAVVSLVANTAPVAFGALAVPITTLSAVSNIPEHTLSMIVGRQTPVLALFVPMVLVLIIDKGKGVRQTLPVTLVCGFTFAVAQFVTSNYISTQLADIVASLVSAGCIVLLLRVWKPAEAYVESEPAEVAAAPDRSSAANESVVGHESIGKGDVAGSGTPGTHRDPARESAEEIAASDAGKKDAPIEVFRAFAPYLLIVVIFVISQLPIIKDLLDAPTVKFQWPGLHLLTDAGKPSTIPTFKLNWLSAAGTLLIISGLLTIPVIKISFKNAVKAYGETYRQLLGAIITVMAVLGLAYVMNASGQTTSLGVWIAGAGRAFAILAPILGWIGVAVTGSDTSSNSLFGALQVTAAKKTGLSPALMAAANSSGGVLGKMISPQNLAIAAAAVGMSGREGDVFRKVVGWSVLFLFVMCVLVYLQSTPILGWMLYGTGA